MLRTAVAWLCIVLSCIAQSSSSAATQATPAPSGFSLEDGTPVKLRLSHTISSADAHTGDTVDFEVLEEVKIGDVVVVPVGSLAWGTVTEAEHKKRMGRGGKLNVNLDTVRLSNGQKAALRAVQGGNGGGHVGAMTGAMVATAIVVWPAAPLFLFMHGKDITIPKGTAITAYINGNIPLEKAAFLPKKEVPVTTADAQGTVALQSNPTGADVELDGNFVGNTPASLNVSAGDHVFTVKKKGFATWERQLKVIGGSVNLNAVLEPESPAPVSNSATAPPPK